MSKYSGSGCILQAVLIIVATMAWSSIESGDGGTFAIIILIAIFLVFFIGLIINGFGNGPGGSERAYDNDFDD